MSDERPAEACCYWEAPDPFGGAGIVRPCYDAICERVPMGGLIFEFGSGPGSTGMLSEKYRMVSVEHDIAFVGNYPVDYVYAPLEGGWYALGPVREKLAELRRRGLRYDLLLVDGPVGSEARAGLLSHLDLFDLSVPVVVDDVERPWERRIVEEIARRTGREPAWFGQFAIV